MNQETLIQIQIQKYLDRNQILNWRNSDSKVIGMPDLMAIYKGHLVGLEIKTDTGKATEIQKRWLQNIRNAGGYADIIRSVEDVNNLLYIIDNDLSEKEGNIHELENYVDFLRTDLNTVLEETEELKAQLEDLEEINKDLGSLIEELQQEINEME